MFEETGVGVNGNEAIKFQKKKKKYHNLDPYRTQSPKYFTRMIVVRDF